MWQYDCFAEDFKLLCEEKKDDIMMVYQQDTGRTNYTYGEVYGLVKRFISFGRDHGLKEGDTIVSIMPNSPEAVICFFAALVGGMNYAPLPPAVSRREYDNWINIVHPQIIIKKQGLLGYDMRIQTIEFACNGNLSWLPTNEDYVTNNVVSKIYLMTSGTTGSPKAISIDGDKLWSSAKMFAQFYGLENLQCRFWNYLPMSYMGGLYNLVLLPLRCKGSFVVSEPFSGKTLLNYWNFVREYEITALWFVPSIVQGLLRLSRFAAKQEVRFDSSKIKVSFLGTAPIQLRLKEEFEKMFGIQVYENYGLSETAVFLAAENRYNIQFRQEGSIGQILPYVSVKLLPVGNMENMYEIWVKTPFLFDGYLSGDGNIELDLDNEQYFNTKDLGYLSENNVLVLSGRSREIIKKGGQFVSLTEIERAVLELSYVDSAAAVPIKHDFYGESYVLCVIFNQQTEVEQQIEKIKRWMKDNFIAYKTPEKICVYQAFPRTASGKIQKNKLVEEIMKAGIRG